MVFIQEKYCYVLINILKWEQEAGVLELADGADSKSVVGNNVWVQVPPPAPSSKGGDYRITDSLFVFNL